MLHIILSILFGLCGARIDECYVSLLKKRSSHMYANYDSIAFADDFACFDSDSIGVQEWHDSIEVKVFKGSELVLMEKIHCARQKNGKKLVGCMNEIESYVDVPKAYNIDSLEVAIKKHENKRVVFSYGKNYAWYTFKNVPKGCHARLAIYDYPSKPTQLVFSFRRKLNNATKSAAKPIRTHK